MNYNMIKQKASTFILHKTYTTAPCPSL